MNASSTVYTASFLEKPGPALQAGFHLPVQGEGCTTRVTIGGLNVDGPFIVGVIPHDCRGQIDCNVWQHAEQITLITVSLSHEVYEGDIMT